MEHVGRAARAARALVEGLVRGKGGGKATQPWSFERVASLLFGACCLLAYACGPGALWASNSDLIGEYLDLKIASVTERMEKVELKVHHLPTNRAAADALRERVHQLTNRVDAVVEETERALKGYRGRPLVTPEHLKKELDAFAADRTGLADYAMHQPGSQAGGRVVAHSKLAPHSRDGGLLGFAARMATGVHELASELLLAPAMPEVPGHCLPLEGSTGWVEIKLLEAIVPTALTIEHLPKGYALDFSSAPKAFSVEGWAPHGLLSTAGRLVGAGGKPTHMGEFEYASAGGAVQVFELDNEGDQARARKTQTLSLHFTPNPRP
mmetsp:Transcript_13049/g.41232  ORF Transcript_13049/g.41232 Transcript_13049/m.41232 type:complete len:324 (-) Transcript_13049:364-1335(-)